MSLTEPERHQIIQWFQEQMGPERGELMMKAIAPVGWHDIATNRDLRELEGQMRAEMQVLRHDVRAEIAELRGEVKAEIAGLRVDLADLRTELHRSLRTQTYTTLGGTSLLLGAFGAVSQLLG